MMDAGEKAETDVRDVIPYEDPSPEVSRFPGNPLNGIITLGVIWLVIWLVPQLTQGPKRGPVILIRLIYPVSSRIDATS